MPIKLSGDIAAVSNIPANDFGTWYREHKAEIENKARASSANRGIMAALEMAYDAGYALALADPAGSLV